MSCVRVLMGKGAGWLLTDLNGSTSIDQIVCLTGYSNSLTNFSECASNADSLTVTVSVQTTCVIGPVLQRTPPVMGARIIDMLTVGP